MGLFGDVLGGVGGFVGDLLGQDDRDRAAGYLDKARQGFEGIDPTVESRALTSKFDAVDPTTRAAELEALAEFRNRYKAGGLDAITRANLGDITATTNRASRTAQASVAQDAARRGIGNSATALMQQQLAGQDAANQGARAGEVLAANEQAGRDAALRGAVATAGQVRGEDYTRAAAQDAISRFNEATRVGAQQATVGNKLARAGGVAGAYGAQAGQANHQAQTTQRRYEGLGEAVGGVGDYFLKPPVGAP